MKHVGEVWEFRDEIGSFPLSTQENTLYLVLGEGDESYLLLNLDEGTQDYVGKGAFEMTPQDTVLSGLEWTRIF